MSISFNSSFIGMFSPPVMEIEPRALHILGKNANPELHPQCPRPQVFQMRKVALVGFGA
jgi:hypothetical protein